MSLLYTIVYSFSSGTPQNFEVFCRLYADENNPLEVGSNIPGNIIKVLVKEGDVVEANQPIATIEAMKQRHAEKRLRDEALRQADAVADGEIVDWQEVQKQWDEYYAQHPEEK